MGRPSGAKSSRPKPGRPRSRSRLLTTMLAVVNRVAMPPSRVPKASGIRRREGFTPDRLAAPETAGRSTAAAAMLFMNSARKEPAAITVTTSRCSLVPATRTRKSATRRATQKAPPPPRAPRPFQPRGGDEDREQRDHRRAAEPGEGLLGGEHPRRAERHHHQQRHQAGPQRLGEQQQHGLSGDDQGDEEVRVHGDVKCPVPESPISTLPPGKYSFHRRVTVAAVASSANSSLGYQGFMRASIRMGGV